MSNVRTIEVEEGDGEEIVTGKLSNQVFIRYFRKGGGIITLVLLVMNFVLSQVVISGGDYWLSYWTNLETARSCIRDTLHHCRLSEKESISIVNNTLLEFYSLLDEDGLLPTNYAIYIYTILIVSCIVLSISRGIFFMTVCTTAGKKLHDDMFFNVIHATMLFFNTNSYGKINFY